MHYSSLDEDHDRAGQVTVSGVGKEGQGVSDKTTEELMKVILANEGDYVFVLSLSGKVVRETSSKAELRKSYLLLSTKVHPDKNPGSQEAKKAFQAVSEAFERLANPEKFDEGFLEGASLLGIG